MNNESFLPDGYQPPAGASKYLKLQQGANKFRILSKSIVGWEYWTNSNKPVRSKEYPTSTPDIKVDKDGKSKISHFWAFVVWDYKGEEIKIYEVTQKTIQNDIMNLYMSDDWGDPKGYDLTVNRTGEKIETEYSTVPTPPKPLAGEIEALYASTEINLEALFSGGDPFAVKQTVEVLEERKEIEKQEIDKAVGDMPW